MVPRTLAENAGMNVARVVSELTEKYTEDLHCGAGVDLEVVLCAGCELGGRGARCDQGGAAHLGRVRDQAERAAVGGERGHYHSEGRPDHYGEGGRRAEAASSAEGRGLELGILACLRGNMETQKTSHVLRSNTTRSGVDADLHRADLGIDSLHKVDDKVD